MVKSKAELLVAVHELIWRRDDLMDQEALFELQSLIEGEIIAEDQAGNLELHKWLSSQV